jgi:peptide/nickel transport system substrate-binding protein
MSAKGGIRGVASKFQDDETATRGGKVKKRKLMATVAMTAVLGLVGAACNNSSTTTTSSSVGGTGNVQRGGTYRTATQEFGYTDAFDPTGEYLGQAWGLYSELLLRALMGYNHQGPAQGGDTPIPDIASGMPTISSDGLTYSFTMKSNVMFGPPVSRAVTSKDILYAFERINLASLAAQYGNYYCGVIVGMTCKEKSLHSISGITTPDATHITFKLSKPDGDFLYRLAMPATAAVPQEVAKCFLQAGQYGRDVISSGPYMIMGEQNLNISSCNTIKPISGYNPNKGVTFIRNPEYQTSSDSPTDRPNYLNGIEIAIDSNLNDIFQKIQSGELDGSYGDTPPSAVEAQYVNDPTKKQYIHADPADRTWYLTMNLLAPPFDDVHVREAMNYIMNKVEMQKAFGGPLHGVPATTVEPPTVLPQTANYAPYNPNGNLSGDLQAALAQMKMSKYKTDSTGKCIDPACNGWVFLGRNYPPWTNVDQVAMADMKEIGLTPKLTEVDVSTGYTTIEKVKQLIPASLVPGWGKDFASPFGFDYFIFDSAGIGCTTAANYSLVGITAAIAKSCGVTPQYDAYVKKYGPVPSIDNQITKCVAESAAIQNTCYANMDKYLMTTAVPWVPWSWGNNLVITSPSVTQYVYDTNAGTISLCFVAVNNNKAPVNVA